MERSDTVYVNQHSELRLIPESTDEGTWNWTGAGTYGPSREQTVNTSAAGTYIARAIFTNSCGIASHLTVNIIVNSITGMNRDKAETGSVRIYPNPAIDLITIQSLSVHGIRYAIIADIFGQTVFKVDFESTGNNNIDISQLSTGTYYLKVLDDEGISVNKFVKMK